MSNITTIQPSEIGIHTLENLNVIISGNESSSTKLDGMMLSWDQFMNELEFE
jgi:hypothetical protein